MKRGDVYWANLHPRSGSEQKGKRPVVVVSTDSFNQIESWRSVTVVPLSTSQAQAKRGFTAPLLPKGSANLTKSSVALCHQITTLDRSKFEVQIGTLSRELLQNVNDGLREALSLV